MSRSISSTWSAWRWCGGSPKVRGKRSETSTTSVRAGSAPARLSSAVVPPACSDRLHHPSASGGAAAVAMTVGWAASRKGARRRKSAGVKEMFAPDSRSARSNGPKNPER